MNYLAFLLEGADNATADGTADPMGLLLTFAPWLLVLVGMMWFNSRSDKKQKQEAQQMRDSLQVGDEVTTIGGIIGKVVSIKDETFVLETTKEKTHIRFLKSAIANIDVRISDLTAVKNEPKETPVNEIPEEEPKKKFGFFGKQK